MVSWTMRLYIRDSSSNERELQALDRLVVAGAVPSRPHNNVLNAVRSSGRV